MPVRGGGGGGGEGGALLQQDVEPLSAQNHGRAVGAERSNHAKVRKLVAILEDDPRRRVEETRCGSSDLRVKQRGHHAALVEHALVRAVVQGGRLFAQHDFAQLKV